MKKKKENREVEAYRKSMMNDGKSERDGFNAHFSFFSALPDKLTPVSKGEKQSTNIIYSKFERNK